MKNMTPAALKLTPAEFRSLTAKISRQSAHRSKMRERLQKQRERVAGFEPTGDKPRQMFDAFRLAVAMENQEQNLQLKPAEIEQRAYNRLCQSFPPMPIARRFTHPTPSKSDNPDYRRGGDTERRFATV